MSSSPSSPSINKASPSMEELISGAESLGITLNETAVERFARYLSELMKWGAKMNLTGPVREAEIISRHFLDSLTLLPCLRALKSKKILDIGSGAGFPGLPLKIAEPALDITLMDSREKRVFFLRHIIRSLGLSEGISAIKARAEALPEGYASGFDCVTARAFAPLAKLLPICMPYLREHGFIIAMKGPAGQEELQGVSVSGLSSPRFERVSLPQSNREALLLIFEKI